MIAYIFSFVSVYSSVLLIKLLEDVNDTCKVLRSNSVMRRLQCCISIHRLCLKTCSEILKPCVRFLAKREKDFSVLKFFTLSVSSRDVIALYRYRVYMSSPIYIYNSSLFYKQHGDYFCIQFMFTCITGCSSSVQKRR